MTPTPVQRLLGGAWVIATLAICTSGAADAWRRATAVFEAIRPLLPTIAPELPTASELVRIGGRRTSIRAQVLAEVVDPVNRQAPQWLVKPQWVAEPRGELERAGSLLVAELLETAMACRKRQIHGPAAWEKPAAEARVQAYLGPTSLTELLLYYAEFVGMPDPRLQVERWLSAQFWEPKGVGARAAAVGVSTKVLDRAAPEWRDSSLADVCQHLGVAPLVPARTVHEVTLDGVVFDLREGPSCLGDLEDSDAPFHVVATLPKARRLRPAPPMEELAIFNALAATQGWLETPLTNTLVELVATIGSEILSVRYVADATPTDSLRRL